MENIAEIQIVRYEQSELSIHCFPMPALLVAGKGGIMEQRVKQILSWLLCLPFIFVAIFREYSQTYILFVKSIMEYEIADYKNKLKSET